MTQERAETGEQSLRARAEEASIGSEQLLALEQDLAAIVHRLKVQQVELEMQNEELRRSEAELKAARNRYRSLFELAPVGCVRLEPGSWEILEGNSAAAGMLGRSPEELVGCPLDQLVWPEDRQAFYQHVMADEEAQVEVRLVRAQALPLWVRLTSRRLEDSLSSGTIRAAWIDIAKPSEPGAAEGEPGLNGRELPQLAGTVAHDLANLLLGFDFHLEQARGLILPDSPVAESLNALEGRAVVIRQLISELRAVSKGRALEREPLDLSQLVSDLEGVLEDSLPEEVELHLEQGQGISEVMASRVQLTQLLINLVLNAGEAVQRSGRPGRVVVRMQAEADGRRLGEPLIGDLSAEPAIALEVSDSGPGLPSGMRQRVFEPFFSTKGGNHRGLGLAAVPAVVQRHSAALFVESSSEGTTFRIVMPARAKAGDMARQDG